MQGEDGSRSSTEALGAVFVKENSVAGREKDTEGTGRVNNAACPQVKTELEEMAFWLEAPRCGTPKSSRQ